ncbi:MAG: phosphate ABC transporter ATP-binding protein PstB [Dehalococcoidales bacterium]
MDLKMQTRHLDFYYGDKKVLKDVSLDMKARQITALIGPSGCGKSTLLRALNRMNDIIPNIRIQGEILLDGYDIYGPTVDVVEIRKKVGMVFQQPNPFPKTIYENIAFGPKMIGHKDKVYLTEVVEKSLRAAAIWDEVKDDLEKSALALSGGQQQRLCIARALAIEPEVILMDEPCSALDPVSTLKIEDLMQELKKEYTIVIVTHNMQQAARVSSWAGFMLIGDLIEYAETSEIFSRPRDKRTEDYITGRFG